MTIQQGQRNKQADTFLSENQQDLLVAALNSQAGGGQITGQASNSGPGKSSSSNPTQQQPIMDTLNNDNLFMSPQEAGLDSFGADYTPELDYLDGDSFDFENADLGGEMIGALPGEQHEKRKNSDVDDAGEEGNAKRQETQDGEKGAKKPGRKPLTSEPTTKRKAQNRAAQRAFRERKEQHLKDLETKNAQLTKAQEADKHENGLLKAQIDRLQVELREYRKRISLNGGSGAKRSPTLPAYNDQTRSNSNPTTNSGSGGNFQFDFPKFGALPGSQIFGNQSYSSNSSSNGHRGSATPPITQSPTHASFSGPSTSQNPQSRSNSLGRSMSPKSVNGSNHQSPSIIPNMNPAFTSYSTNNNMHGFASTLPQMSSTSSDPFGDLFSPSILKGAQVDNSGNYFGNNSIQANGAANTTNGISDGDSTAGLNRVFQFNSNASNSDSASPSGSSASQWNANANSSSCGTSPEPSHDSPANKPKNADTFCDKINPAKNPSTSNGFNNTNPSYQQGFNQFGNVGAGDYSIPSLDSFDPVLFGDYRDPNDTLLGGGDFTGGFFDEALNPAGFDMASPSNLFGILQSPQQSNASLGGGANAPTPSRNLMAEMDKARDGGDDDYGLLASSNKKKDSEGELISCNNIWNQLQSNPDFQEGKFDLDNLCSELRAKARCSESGVMVGQEHVDAALRKLGKKDEQTGKVYDAPTGLMFEQASWDNVLKKMGGR
ncbi:DNA-binding transcription factor yap1 [Vermiconidia calcicola]|uniref:DNA-binding transcription factor yap1 n=1 Tax=Vermiconidia calcicola TaxID=1690605 RepID=A0ACC3M8Q0_9PEZI|nr:DNA-binding transcription factor yap1 [Vermiconidia calcicola]